VTRKLSVSLCVFFVRRSIEVQIDSITHHDPSISERIFGTLPHQKQSKTISLVLNTKELRSNMYNNSSWIPSYRLFPRKHDRNEYCIDSKKSDVVLQKIMQDLENNRKGLLIIY
jgi:hypothetical protein